MLNLRDSDIEFIRKNIGENSVLLKTDDICEFIDTLSEWIDYNGFDETGENYSDLGREAQRVFDYAFANC